MEEQEKKGFYRMIKVYIYIKGARRNGYIVCIERDIGQDNMIGEDEISNGMSEKKKDKKRR